MCKEGCFGVEWWENYNSVCYKCIDLLKKIVYFNINDLVYLFYVFFKSNI